MVVPTPRAPASKPCSAPPLMRYRQANSSSFVLVRSSTWATLAMLASASPRKPSVWIASKSSCVRILLVAWRRNAVGTLSASMPVPSSLTSISSTPPRRMVTLICAAPASMAFSQSSFTTELGRSTTSPAAISSAVWLSSTCICAMVSTSRFCMQARLRSGAGQGLLQLV